MSEDNIKAEVERLASDATLPVDKAWMEASLEQHPYFPVPLLLYLQRTENIDDAERKQLLERLALMCPDRASLHALLDSEGSYLRDFYPPEEPAAELDTTDAIDVFLDNFAGGTNKREVDSLTQLIFNPTPEYADILAFEDEKKRKAGGAKSEPVSESAEDALISRFIDSSRKREQSAPEMGVIQPQIGEAEKAEMEAVSVAPVEEAEQGTFSESLAKIYIRQHKYSKALEIISGISLNFPEKSIYFADQIRFLRKLVENEKLKNKK